MAYDAGLAKTLSQIGRLEQTIAKLVEIPRKIAEDVVPEINRLIQKQFDDGQDPYGRPWAPLKKATIDRGRKPPPLTDTRKLRNGTKVYVLRANYAGLRIVVGESYGYFHQVGTKNMAARRILPSAGMPSTWKQAFDNSAKRVAR